MTETLTVQTPDGRTLCVERAGDHDGPAIVVHSGTPNSRLLFAPWAADAAERGAQILAYDRPGYGGSDRHPGHTVADGAADTLAVADALGLERFVAWGLSGGGPYALACAALLPDRVAAVALIGSIAPYGAPGLDYFEGMGEDNVDDIDLLLRDPDAASRKAAQDREEMLAVTVEDLGRGMESLVSPVDAAVLSGPFGAHFHAEVQDGLAPGPDGWMDDGVAHVGYWGFEPAAIRVPVKVWHGAQDRFVPRGHGEWFARTIPGAEASLTETDGHLTVVDQRIGEVHEWLLERLSGA
jgi:pimeloyl-ACP methyl ester carboxylesterase